VPWLSIVTLTGDNGATWVGDGAGNNRKLGLRRRADCKERRRANDDDLVVCQPIRYSLFLIIHKCFVFARRRLPDISISAVEVYRQVARALGDNLPHGLLVLVRAGSSHGSPSAGLERPLQTTLEIFRCIQSFRFRSRLEMDCDPAVRIPLRYGFCSSTLA
jgi:hypothetical protein